MILIQAFSNTHRDFRLEKTVHVILFTLNVSKDIQIIFRNENCEYQICQNKVALPRNLWNVSKDDCCLWDLPKVQKAPLRPVIDLSTAQVFKNETKVMVKLGFLTL